MLIIKKNKTIFREKNFKYQGFDREVPLLSEILLQIIMQWFAKLLLFVTCRGRIFYEIFPYRVNPSLVQN